MTLTVGSLFSGIGGLDLGLERAGMEVRWQCEKDEYCQKVLRKHWPEAVLYDDITTLSGRSVQSVDVLAGGFPCQDVSTAGKRAGIKEGTRSGLWAEYARLIGEIEPRWVIIENVPGLLSIDAGRGMGTVLYDLAIRGYDAEWDCISAASVGALHRRDRIFIVAHANGDRCDAQSLVEGELSRAALGTAIPPGEQRQDSQRSMVALADSYDDGRQGQGIHIRPGRQDQTSSIVGRPGQDVPDPNGILLHRSGTPRNGRHEPANGGEDAPHADAEGPQGLRAEHGLFAQGRPSSWAASGGWWATEPDVGRVADGVPARVDRLRTLGNAVVPQVAEYIGRLIVETEGGVA